MEVRKGVWEVPGECMVNCRCENKCEKEEGDVVNRGKSGNGVIGEARSGSEIFGGARSGREVVCDREDREVRGCGGGEKK